MEMLKQAYHFSFGLIADFSPKVTPKNTIFRIFSKMHQNEPIPFDEFCIFLQR